MAKNQNTVAAYREFLQKHPDSEHADRAKERIAAIEDAEDAVNRGDIEWLLVNGPHWERISKAVELRGVELSRGDVGTVRLVMPDQYSSTRSVRGRDATIVSKGVITYVIQLKNFWYDLSRDFMYFSLGDFTSDSAEDRFFSRICYYKGKFYRVTTTPKKPKAIRIDRASPD